MRLHNWEKWSDSDLPIWTALPENNTKIKPNIGPQSSYLHEATTHTQKNRIISVAETWLLTLAMLSPPLCANKVIRIELGEADAQEELRKMLSIWISDSQSWSSAKGYSNSWEESVTLASSPALRKLQDRFLEGTPRWLGTNRCQKEEKEGPSHYLGLDRLK